jgi:hypothetical protein
MVVETEQLTREGWILLAVSAVVGLAAVVFAARRPVERRMEVWAGRFGLRLTDSNRALVATYLRRTRSLRAVGGVIGWLASPAYVALTDRPFPLGGNALALALGGYLLGAVVAEATFLPRRRGKQDPRSASLVPRSLEDYVSPIRLWSLRLLALPTVALAVLYAVVPRQPGQPVDPSVPYVFAVAVAIVAFAVAVEAILRAIVARPQPAMSDELVAADDAIRASSIHALSGAAMGMLLVGAGWALYSVGAVTSVRPLRSVLPWLAVAAFGLALWTWIGLTQSGTWRVRHDAGFGRAG